MKANAFECINCHKKVNIEAVGTANRNHCPFCLASKHVDLQTPGDRKSTCKQGMEPIGLTFKFEGTDKWGRQKQGELMLIHRCTKDNKISINRIAGDDDPEEILKVLKKSENLDESIKNGLEQSRIRLLTSDDFKEIKTQLFGKT